MRPRARERRPARDDERARAEAPARAPEPAVLALQRSAGNAAVAAWLQRDRKLPKDADSLADLGDTAKEMIVDDAAVSMSSLPYHFRKPRVPAKMGIKVTTEFGGRMAAKEDAEKEKALREGLGTIGMMIFGLDGERPKEKGEEDVPGTAKGKRRAPTADRVHFKDLDLTKFGGQDGRYRFTAVAAKGSGSAPKEVLLIVELLGARRPALRKWDELDEATRKKLLARFKGFGFVKHVPGSDEPALEWKNDDFGKVLQALELIPDGMLKSVQGIRWVRGHQPSAPAGEAGHYETKTGLVKDDKPERKLTVRGDAFASDEELIGLVAHEIGHAVSSKPAEPKGGKALSAQTGKGSFQEAAKADSKLAITEYGKTDAEESYAEAYSLFITEPDTLKLMRPKTYEWFVKQQAANQLPPPAKAPAQAPPAAKPPAKVPVPAGKKG